MRELNGLVAPGHAKTWNPLLFLGILIFLDVRLLFAP